MALDDGGHSGWREPNELERYSIGLRERPRFDRDGSLTLRIQREPRGAEQQVNWLPAPLGEFVLTLHMLGPRAKPPSILPPGEGSWALPGRRRAD
jgi:hypothetical protein